MTTTPYDEVEYPGFPYPDTHPDHLATLATLFGMAPPAVDTCRVLELGCGDGSNLVPIALSLPASTCVGVDLAARPIERAEACARALGLTNVTFRRQDLARLEPALGRFDYVVAHGVYSWVSADVRDRLLGVCREHLAPQGVAFVSYNAHPGGHLREVVRGIMRFRARVAPAARQVEEGLALAQWVAESTPSEDLRRVLESELQVLTRRVPSAVFHDELSPTYAPVYFCDFMDHAARHGLQYLADAELGSMQSAHFPAPLAQTLHEIGDVLVKEQLQDFLRLRKFRQTLLCHTDVRLDRAAAPERVRSLRASAAARRGTESVEASLTAGTETSPAAETSSPPTDPLMKAVLQTLEAVRPRRLTFADLATMVETRRRADSDASAGVAGLEQVLLTAYSANLVELHVGPGAFTLEVTVRPLSSALARWQLGHGTTVTTLRHAAIKIEDALLRRLVLLLDGTRDQPALLRELIGFVQSGEGRLERDGRVITDHAEIAEVLTRELPKALAGVAHLSLLMA